MALMLLLDWYMMMLGGECGEITLQFAWRFSVTKFAQALSTSLVTGLLFRPFVGNSILWGNLPFQPARQAGAGVEAFACVLYMHRARPNTSSLITAAHAMMAALAAVLCPVMPCVGLWFLSAHVHQAARYAWYRSNT
jgi:hypothetical protein